MFSSPVLLVIWAYYAIVRGEAGLAAMARETLFLLLFSGASALLSYHVITLNLPLVDDELVAIDRALGFDWLTYVGVANDSALIGDLSSLFYIAALPSVALAIAVLPLAGKTDRAEELLLAVMIGALAAIAVSGVLPASGALAHFRDAPGFSMENRPLVDLKYMQPFFDLRDGNPVLFALSQPKGLIAFPSYHVALGVIVTLAFRDMPRLLVPVALVNGAMILTTPIDGGHHMVDGIAGAVLGVAAVRAAAAIRAAIARHEQAVGRRPVKSLSQMTSGCSSRVSGPGKSTGHSCGPRSATGTGRGAAAG
ncbi:MAG: phosphatase PAP2 family protein [Hyphomicrobiales bacterium]